MAQALWQWSPAADVFSPAAAAASEIDDHNSTAPAQADAASDGSSLECERFVGEFVEVHSLQGAPALNGRRGRIIKFVKETSRLEVRLEGDEATKGVKPANCLRFAMPADPPKSLTLLKSVKMHLCKRTHRV